MTGYIYEKDVPTMTTEEGFPVWPVSASELKAAREQDLITHIVGPKGKCFYKREWLDAYVTGKVKRCADNGNTKAIGSTTTSEKAPTGTPIGTSPQQRSERDDKAAKALKERISRKRKTGSSSSSRSAKQEATMH